MWEKLRRTDAWSVYRAARLRAITAAVAGQTPGADAAGLAKKESDLAMTWLRKAFATGFPGGDASQLLNDPDLAALRNRADFAALLWELAETPPKP
jgi:hypothetical protein